MAVDIESLSLGRGGLTVVDGTATGWIPAGTERSACLLVGHDGAVITSVPLEAVASGKPRPEGETAFSVTGDALARLIQAVGARLPHRYDLALVLDQAVVAQTPIDFVAPALAGQGDTPEEEDPPPQSVGAEPVGPLSLARAETATLVRELVVASDPGLVRDTLHALYKGGERETLWRLWDELNSGSGRENLDAYLAFYFAQAMLQQNMAGPAYEALAGLVHHLSGLQP
jgi:hypothetical protein